MSTITQWTITQWASTQGASTQGAQWAEPRLAGNDWIGPVC